METISVYFTDFVINCKFYFLRITVLLVIKKDLVAIDRIVKRIVRSCEGGGGDDDDGGHGRGGRDGGGGRGADNCKYKDCRWDGGGRNDDISFVSDVS